MRKLLLTLTLIGGLLALVQTIVTPAQASLATIAIFGGGAAVLMLRPDYFWVFTGTSQSDQSKQEFFRRVDAEIASYLAQKEKFALPPKMQKSFGRRQ